MRLYIFSMFMLGIVVFLFLSVKPGFAPRSPCPDNMVPVGRWCVDQYEASAWSMPPDRRGNPQGIQYGVTSDDYPCVDNGNNCSMGGTMIFAAPVPGVIPSAFITWFQAQQACGNVGKQLPPNAIWQMAAAGTPDPGTDNDTTDCNISGPTFDLTPTGSRTNCISNYGVYDMVGNVLEWVEDWVPLSTVCVTPLFAGDFNCLAGANTISGPGALIRGGAVSDGTSAGVFALRASIAPSGSGGGLGFRCAQPQ